MDDDRNKADPCLYHVWNHKGSTVWLSWINGSLLLGNKKKNSGKIWLHGGRWDEKICEILKI